MSTLFSTNPWNFSSDLAFTPKVGDFRGHVTEGHVP